MPLKVSESPLPRSLPSMARVGLAQVAGARRLPQQLLSADNEKESEEGRRTQRVWGNGDKAALWRRFFRGCHKAHSTHWLLRGAGASCAPAGHASAGGGPGGGGVREGVAEAAPSPA